MDHPEPHTLTGHSVRFRVRDVYMPEPVSVLEELHAREVLEGTVVDVSDGGSENDTFVLVSVNGLRHPCIVAVTRILSATAMDPGAPLQGGAE